MTLFDVVATQRVLHQNIVLYTRRIHMMRIEEANSCLIIIKKCCDDLGVDWEVLMNKKDGYLFKTVTENAEPSQALQTVTETVLSVTEPLQCEKCLSCRAPLTAKKAGAKFCSNKCKTDFHRNK